MLLSISSTLTRKRPLSRSNPMTGQKQRLQAITLGCSKNKVDTEHVLSQIEHIYDIVPEGEDVPVDVILLNT